MTATLNAVIGRALSQVGGYYPGNSPYGVWYDSTYSGNNGVYDAAQFCAMGLSWVFAQEGALDIFPAHAYTPSGVNAWKARGQWHDGTKGIQPGDVLYFDFPGAPNRVSHVGLALSAWKNGVDTVEFNTSGTGAGDQRNGRVVARKRRTTSIVGYGRPNYSAAPAVPAVSAGEKRPVILEAMEAGSETGNEARWQRALWEMGFRSVGNPDGNFGPKTTQATRNFQAARGLEVDGVAGPYSVSAALLTDGDSRLRQGDEGARVALLQVIVGTNPDGAFGPKTKRETQEVQRYFGVSDDGVVGPVFVSAYRKEAA